MQKAKLLNKDDFNHIEQYKNSYSTAETMADNYTLAELQKKLEDSPWNDITFTAIHIAEQRSYK